MWRIKPFQGMFVIAAVGSLCNLGALKVGVLAIAWVACAYGDNWLALRERAKVLNSEITWQQDSDDPSSENQGAFNRVKLDSSLQCVVTRVGELIGRML
jgi:hypothetical protein